MYDYKHIIDLSNGLINAVQTRDSLKMQTYLDELELAYKTAFGDKIDGYESWYAFVLMHLASAHYFAYNNMYGLMHAKYDEIAQRMDGFRSSTYFSNEEISKIESLFQELERIHLATPTTHQNLVVSRCDSRCCLCRLMPANKTGSHMVPNFLAHPTFSWDGKGKRFHEALNHDFMNAPDWNCQFYGREVPDWRFAQGCGKIEVSEDDINNNINQLEFDNEFCSRCENRFGVLESAYSQFYNGQKKQISPRVAYLFWLSVLWRMSMGSMSIFMDLYDELSLRRLLDNNILDTIHDIENCTEDLGNWQYAIFRAEGLRDGDKGIFGYRKESHPYVVMYNDLVMVFYHDTPNDDELTLGPICVKRDNLNCWHNTERYESVDRRWFWNVRDWIVETSYDYYDPIREKTLITIREQERSEDKIISNSFKNTAIRAARLPAGPQNRPLRLHKMTRISMAWMRQKEAIANGNTYNPLEDEELFLQQRDFDMYYYDLAQMSSYNDYHDDIPSYPFYKEAREAIPDDREWAICNKDCISDDKYFTTMKDFISKLSPKDIDHLLYGISDPYTNPFRDVGRNDLCPCGSGKKYKKCCGRKRM